MYYTANSEKVSFIERNIITYRKRIRPWSYREKRICVHEKGEPH